MEEVKEVMDFLVESHQLMSKKRIEKELKSKFKDLYDNTDLLFKVEFDDDVVYILYYHVKDEVQIEVSIKLVWTLQ